MRTRKDILEDIGRQSRRIVASEVLLDKAISGKRSEVSKRSPSRKLVRSAQRSPGRKNSNLLQKISIGSLLAVDLLKRSIGSNGLNGLLRIFEGKFKFPTVQELEMRRLQKQSALSSELVARISGIDITKATSKIDGDEILADLSLVGVTKASDIKKARADVKILESATSTPQERQQAAESLSSMSQEAQKRIAVQEKLERIRPDLTAEKKLLSRATTALRSVESTGNISKSQLENIELAASGSSAASKDIAVLSGTSTKAQRMAAAKSLMTIISSKRSAVDKEIRELPRISELSTIRGEIDSAVGYIRSYKPAEERAGAGRMSLGLAEGGPSRSVSGGAKGALLDFIAGGEGGRYGYEAEVYDLNARPGAPGYGKKLTDMTIAEVYELQQSMLQYERSNGSGDSSAVGRYQFIHSTLVALVSKLGIPLTSKFSPSVQDDLAWELVKQDGLDEWLSGRISTQDFESRLSGTWASLPDPSKGGNGFYQGQNSLHSLRSFDAVLAEVQEGSSTRIADSGQESSSQAILAVKTDSHIMQNDEGKKIAGLSTSHISGVGVNRPTSAST